MLEKFRSNLSGLPRSWKRAVLVIFDFFALLTVLWLAYSLRLNTRFVPSSTQLGLMLIAPVIAIPVFMRFGLYRAVIRYLPERAVWNIFQAMTLATLLWVALVFLTELSGRAGAPRSIPVLYWAMGLVVISGSRFAAKRFLASPEPKGQKRPRVLIFGAGAAGVQLASAMLVHGGRVIVGFIDDDPNLQGHDVSGIRVYSRDQIAGLIKNRGVKEIILSMPSISPARRQAIYPQLAKHDVTIRTLPSITDLAAGKYIINQIREIDIDDLLGRSSVPADPGLISKIIDARVVMVTGAGGSIGSELTRLIARAKPEKLILLEANEHALYQIDRQLGADSNLELVPVLGSVCNGALVAQAIKEHGVDVLFHAAAHKHVPLVESNVIEAANNNVFGTRTIAKAAFENGVKHFVLISTDKAVRPTSAMGATKRWAEMIVRDFGLRAEKEQTGQRFCAVRFGNVLGSNGSVVPLFREQIAKGGPITVTDKKMTRYFMSIHEAAELIVQAGALSKGGDIFLLEMGAPVSILELAKNMIRLAGMELKSEKNPDGDIEIKIVGKRKGEKIHEELFYEPGLATKTRQPKILRARRGKLESDELVQVLRPLRKKSSRAMPPGSANCCSSLQPKTRFRHVGKARSHRAAPAEDVSRSSHGCQGPVFKPPPTFIAQCFS